MFKKSFSRFLVATLVVGFLIPFTTSATATPGDVLINEFNYNGDYWVEFMNTTASDINFASSTWQFVSTNLGPSGVSTTTISSGVIPANGIFTLSSSTLAGPLPTSTEGTLLSLINDGTTISSMSYGSSTFATEPHITTSSMPSATQSAVRTSTSTWDATSTITHGWFNESAPTVDSIVATISSSSITTNWATSTDSSAISGLYFEKAGAGRVTFNSTLNLTNASTTAFLQALGTKMTAAAGSMKFDARTATDLKNAGAVIAVYGLTTNGYSSSSFTGASNITVRDDDGVAIATSSPNYPSLTSLTWSAGNSGTLTFNTSHFTQFDFNPTLTEVTPVRSYTSSTSPSFTFSSNATGTTSFLGNCSSTATSTTANGNNTVTLGPLSVGTYSNCSVKVVDLSGASSTLAMTTFTIDTTAPTAPLLPTAGAGPIISIEEKNAGVAIVVGLGTSGAVAGDTLDLLLGGSVWTTPKTHVLTGGEVTAGTYTFTVAAGDGWGSDGLKNITARVTDAAGNIGSVSSVLTLNLFTSNSGGSTGSSSGSSYTYVAPTPVVTQTTTTTTTTTTPAVVNTPVTTQQKTTMTLAEAQQTLNALIRQLQTMLADAKAKGNPIPAGAEAFLPSSVKLSEITRTLSSGIVGDDVKSLQQFLNKKGFTVSTTGPGSVGNETTKFGAATRAALAKFQASVGITPASGIFGSITRAYLMSIGE